ncbi:MAG: hypothetical protein AAFV33_09260 [Chloroflexota bacterium]
MSDKYTLFEEVLNQLVGEACWSVLVSGGLDNGATLSFGNKMERAVPLDSPNLTDDQKLYTGAFELAIADCTWRLDSPNQIVTSWSDEETVKREYLGYLVEQPVSAWEITWPGLDLTLHFANHLSLRLFCDQTDPVDSGENYSLLSPDYTLNVGIRSALAVSPRGST